MNASIDAAAVPRFDFPDALCPRGPAGERYLAGRGLDVDALLDRGLVLFDDRGRPALRLCDLETGESTGYQWREIQPGIEPKIRARKGSRLVGAALSGRLTDLDEGRDVAVICEGLVDTLVACLAWPTAAVFGSPGASQLGRIAGVVARRVAELNGWLLLVADNDDSGVRAATMAVRNAIAAGLTLAPNDAPLDGVGQIRLVDLGDHHDLADAWRAGWRWQWPELPRRAA